MRFRRLAADAALVATWFCWLPRNSALATCRGRPPTRTEKSVTAAPNFTPAIYILGVAVAAAGNDAEAANAWMIATGLPDADPPLYAQAIDAMIRSGRVEDAARLADDARSRWATDADIFDRIVAIAGARERAAAVETLTRGSTLNGTRRVLRIAALHDLALNTPPQSAAWQGFVTEAERFLNDPEAGGKDSVERLLRDPPR